MSDLVKAVEKFMLDSLTNRDKILALENAMKQSDLQIDIPLKHYFSTGIYAREVVIPAGTIVTGKIHKTEHICIISKGKITVLTENGVQTITAPYTMISPPGTKRAAFAHEETVWTAIHGTEETDLDILETKLIAKDFSETDLLSGEEINKLINGGIE